MNIAIIEIKPNKDKIYNYLEIDENEISKNEKNLEIEHKNKLIYIIYYQNEEVSVSYDLIDEIKDNNKINYYYRIEEGLSSNPILSLKTFKVIGIHYNISHNIKLNYGIFIKYLIDKINNNKYKNEINIIYKTDKEGKENIFGYQFVKNNKYNIELIINGVNNDLINDTI